MDKDLCEKQKLLHFKTEQTASKNGILSFKATVRRNTATGEIYISSVGGNSNDRVRKDSILEAREKHIKNKK